ncbi:MAG: hypothetical protein ACKOEN_09315 [Betaproteobacteria bacterium]
MVIDQLTVWEAASATSSLAVIAVGCSVTVPAIVGYTIFSYRVFSGKVAELQYA